MFSWLDIRYIQTGSRSRCHDDQPSSQLWPEQMIAEIRAGEHLAMSLLFLAPIPDSLAGQDTFNLLRESIRVERLAQKAIKSG
jgi:hypothetical protein